MACLDHTAAGSSSKVVSPYATPWSNARSSSSSASDNELTFEPSWVDLILFYLSLQADCMGKSMQVSNTASLTGGGRYEGSPGVRGRGREGEGVKGAQYGGGGRSSTLWLSYCSIWIIMVHKATGTGVLVWIWLHTRLWALQTWGQVHSGTKFTC